MLVVEQHRDVDVALAPRRAARPASMQPSETHRGVAAQGARKVVAEPSNVFVAGGRGHVALRSKCIVAPPPGDDEDSRRRVGPQRWWNRHPGALRRFAVPRESGVGRRHLVFANVSEHTRRSTVIIVEYHDFVSCIRSGP